MWFYIPSASAPDLRDLSSRSTLRALASSSQSCTLSTKSPSPKSLRLALKRGRFPRLRSGLTSKQSALRRSANTYADGCAANGSDCSARDIPVSRGAAPVSAVVETIRATFGPGLLTRLISIAPRSSGSRMSQRTLFTDSATSVEISRTEAIAFRRAYGRRLRLALRTSGSDCSSLGWMTPRCATGAYTRDSGDPGRERLSLEGEAQNWSTPGGMGGGTVSRGGERKGELLLVGEAINWPTPVANDDQKTPEAHLRMKQRMGERDGTGSNRTMITSLNVAAQAWTTPQAHDVRKRSKGQTSGKLNDAGNRCLHTDATTFQPWGTPRASDYKGADSNGHHIAKNYLTGHAEQEFQHGHPPETTPPAGEPSSMQPPGSPPPSLKRKLNPDFVEWLMGFPNGWSASFSSSGTIVCGPAEMESWRSRQRGLLCSYLRRISRI